MILPGARVAMLFLLLSVTRPAYSATPPLPTADELLNAVFAQVAPLRRLEVEILSGESPQQQRVRSLIDLDAQRVAQHFESPFRRTAYFDRDDSFLLIRYPDGRQISNPAVSSTLLRDYTLFPEPKELFDPAAAFAFKIRRVDAKLSNPGAGEYVVILANEAGIHPALRESWLIKRDPGLLLRLDVIARGGRRKPVTSALTITWQSVGGLMLPTEVTRTLDEDGIQTQRVTRWLNPIANGTFTPDWFPIP